MSALAQGATVQQAEEQKAVVPKNFDGGPERVVEIATDSLIAPPSLGQAVEKILEGGLYKRSAVEEALASLILGNLLLAGPPGTGKTQLARLLAGVFNVELIEETANPEWSVYDVIGAPSLAEGGKLSFRHGVVPRAILRGASLAVTRMDNGEGVQGAWLLIDEINRAEIDRAFGPLFTALSGEDIGSFTLDYMENHPSLAIPRRFRIIATMNDYDTRFVNTMSAALRRRFARTLVLPPPNEGEDSSPGELAMAFAKAAALVETRMPGKSASSRASLEPFSAQIRRFFGALRALGFGGIPLGTAQIIDTCAYAMVLVSLKGAPADEDKFWALFDRCLSVRLVSGLESDATRLRLEAGYVDALGARCPQLPKPRHASPVSSVAQSKQTERYRLLWQAALRDAGGPLSAFMSPIRTAVCGLDRACVA